MPRIWPAWAATRSDGTKAVSADSAQDTQGTQDAPSLELVPGVRRLRPDDHFMILAETDASPMHVGALLLLDVPETAQADFPERMRAQLLARLGHTPLPVRHFLAPEGYDSEVWADVDPAEAEAQIDLVEDGPRDMPSLLRWAAGQSMQRLDLSAPPFRIRMVTGLEATGLKSCCALFVQMHHALADGIGFQTVLRLLSDETPPFTGQRSAAPLPDLPVWRALAETRFAALEPLAKAQREARSDAAARLKAIAADPARARPATPTLNLSAPTSTARAYAVISLDFAEVKRIARALKATINDLFLALASTALRSYLLEIDDLPADPIVVNSARSYRRADHGDFGNRIVAMHPHLATNIADPMGRLRAIQESMARELDRTAWDEAMLDQPERPYGARDRRAAFAGRVSDGKQVLPGNITLSNVPGPAEVLRYAGHRTVANYPVPIIGSGRFLNITSRRNAGRLDIAIMADAEKIAHVDRFPGTLEQALDIYAALAR